MKLSKPSYRCLTPSPLRFRTLRPAICYILKQSLPYVISFSGLYVNINCIYRVMRSFFSDILVHLVDTLTGYVYIIIFTVESDLCFLNLLFACMQYDKYDVNKIPSCSHQSLAYRARCLSIFIPYLVCTPEGDEMAVI